MKTAKISLSDKRSLTYARGKVKTMYNLDEINRRRIAQGKKPLTHAEARKAEEEHRRANNGSGFSLTDFLIGQATGIAYNGSSAIGTIFHDSGNTCGSATNTSPVVSNDSSFSGGGGGFGGGGNSGSFGSE